MQRDLGASFASPFDLVVVGGGIHGLFAAGLAASRGARVALVERSDYGGGLSFNHQGTIRGGLDEVTPGRLAGVRRRVKDRRAWAFLAPHLVRPLPFLAGTYRFTTSSRTGMRLRFAAFRLLSRSENRGVPPELHLPRTRLESRAATRRLFPGVQADGLTGGAVWYDYRVDHPERLNWIVALAARRAGAVLVNHVEAVGAEREHGRLTGIRVRDRSTGRSHDLACRAALLAVGGDLSAIAPAFGASGGPAVALALNVLLDRPARDIATVARGAGGRPLAVVPWRGRVLVGHSLSSPLSARPADPTVPAAAIHELLAEAGRAFPALQPTASAVRMIHHGFVPVRRGRGQTTPLDEPLVTSYARRGVPGLFALVGESIGSAPRAAAAAVDLIARECGWGGGRVRPHAGPLPHAEISDVEGRLAETTRATGVQLDRETTAHLSSWYGSEAPAVVVHCVERGLTDRLPGSPLLSGEIAYAAEHADALRLDDAVLRRTPLGSAGPPAGDALERAAEVMGSCLGWSADERRQAMADVERQYRWEA
jgi:glycerol-3-phosphate dehydrogenase